MNSVEDAKYTDWSLDVRLPDNSDGNEASDVVSYSVHRYQLGLQSEYFEGIFRDSDEGRFSESHQKCSTIKLPTPIIKIQHFEYLLDYLYTSKFRLDSNNAIPMVYFGDYFGIIPLKERAQSFIRKIIATAHTCASETDTSVSFSMILSMLYKDATIQTMEELQEAIVYVCACEPALMSKDTELSKIPDIQFWSLVSAAKKSHPQNKSSNKLWSINICNFIVLHSDIVDHKIFCKLTHKDSLPIISANVALVLMEQQHQRVEDIEGGRDTESKCLEQHCVDSLIDIETGVWKIKNPHTLLEGRTGNIPRTVLESLLLLSAMDDKEQPIIRRDSVTVSGAGSEFVNGVYTISGLHEDCPMFIRSGTYKGRNGLFYIYHYHSGYWYISFIREGRTLGNSREIELYETQSSGRLSTDNSWWKAATGEEPSPTLEFVHAYILN